MLKGGKSMTGDTKERIRETALELFSEKGYPGTSMSDIAGRMGLTKAALYKHYAGKQEIFDAIVEATAARYQRYTDQIDIHVQDAGQDFPVFTEISADALAEKVRQIFLYSLHDEAISRFRRMMTIEQFRSQELSGLYTRRYGGLSRGDFPKPDLCRRASGGGPGNAGHDVCGAGDHAAGRLRPGAGKGSGMPCKAGRPCPAVLSDISHGALKKGLTAFPKAL